MATVNELLLDAALSHEIDLGQYSAGVARRLISILNRTDSSLAAQLATALEGLSVTSFTVQRLDSLLASVRRLNLQAYRQIERALTEELQRFAVVEAAYHERLWTRAIPGEIQVRYRVASITADQVYAAAMSRPFQGRLLRDWAIKLPEDKLAYVRNAVRQGYVEGQTVADIVRGIRGTRAAGYADGKLMRPRRELETVVRAAVQHTAATARDEFQEANVDLLAAVVWSSTLDTRTSETCIVRDGKKYTAVAHKPIGHKIPWGAGPGKIHWNCRSSSQPVTKSWRELGFDIAELSPGTRASMDGQVPAEIKYREWLLRQSAYRQDQVLGPVRGKLLREGKLPIDEMYTPRGQWLSLEQLRSRHEDEFKRAGV
jgi:hypothetical protein